MLSMLSDIVQLPYLFDHPWCCQRRQPRSVGYAFTADCTQVVPWDYDFTSDDYDGLFISNGPGDPSLCRPTIYNIA